MFESRPTPVLPEEATYEYKSGQKILTAKYAKSLQLLGLRLTDACRFDFGVKLTRKSMDAPWSVIGEIGLTLGRAKPGRSTSEPVDADEFFFKNEDRGSLKFVIPAVAHEQFLKAVFGRRVRLAGRAKSLALRIRLSRVEGAAPSDDREPRFWIETDGELIALRGTVGFRRIDMRFVDSRGGRGAWLASALACDTPAAQGDPGRCAMPALPLTRGKTLLSTPFQPYWRKETSTGLTLFTMGPLPDKELPRARKHAPDRPLIVVSFSGSPAQPDVFFRGSDHPRNTAAFLLGQMQAELISQADVAPRCTFPLAQGLIVRQDRSGDAREAIFETLRGAISDKPFELKTIYGSLIVEGDPQPDGKAQSFDADQMVLNGEAASKRAGAGASMPAIEINWRPPAGMTQLIATAFDDRLRYFSARARLRQVPILLPSEGGAPAIAADVWSRLDFDGSEIGFRLSGDLDPLREKEADWRAEGSAGLVVLGAKPGGGEDRLPGFEVALDGARLQARRESDNLALTFGFSGLALRLDGGGRGVIYPDAKRNSDTVGVRPAHNGKQGVRYDRRAKLIVHFPPQHVAEKAYYRQIDDGVRLPDPAPKRFILREADGTSSEVTLQQALLAWRKMPAEPDDVARLDRRRKIFEALKGSDQAYDKFCSALEQLGAAATSDDPLAALKVRWKAVPDAQRIYLGTDPLALDPDVRILLLEFRRHQLGMGGAKSDGLKDIASREAAIAAAVANLPEAPPPESLTDSSDEQFIREGAKRDWTFEAIAKAYRERKKARYPGKAKLRAALLNESPEKLSVSLRDLEWVQKQAAEKLGAASNPFDEPFDDIAAARLSGASRLVFLVQGVTEKAPIPFTLDGLTSWGRFDLSVVQRAQTVEKLVGGRQPHEAMRLEDGDAANILAHMGIRPYRTIEGRLQDIRNSLTPPDESETAIEIPFRLILSPDQFSRFRTRHAPHNDLFRDGAGDLPDPVLWSAELVYLDRPSRLRAVWSPDFRPGVFERGARAPGRGPYAPWKPGEENPQSNRFRTALDAYDRHELVALSSVHGMPVLGRRSLDGYGLIDGSQYEPPESYKLKGMQSEKDNGRDLGDLSAIYKPQPLNLQELRLTAYGGSLRHDTSFIPPAAARRQGDTFPLFESFSIERWRQITTLGRDIEVEVVYKGYLYPLGVRASLVKLTERRFMRSPSGTLKAFLVQRKFIRIGKPDKLFPAIGQPDGSRRFPVSRLDMLTRVTPDIIDPEIEGRATGAPANETRGGRVDFSWNAKPDPSGLVFWPRTSPGSAGNIQFELAINGQGGALRMPLLFVDNVAVNNPGVLAALTKYYNEVDAALRTVRHGGVKRRYADELTDGDCTYETDLWQIAAEGRRGDSPKGASGAPVPEFDLPKSMIVDEATKKAIKTVNQDFHNDPFLEGLDQPPFYPMVALASVRIGSAERFVGRSLPLQRVVFAEIYRDAGFVSAKAEADSIPEIHLELCSPLKLDMGGAGDRSGGLGRPAINLTYLSRKIGIAGAGAPPSSDKADKEKVEGAAPTNRPAPASKAALMNFFDPDAKILGLVSFKALLELVDLNLQFPSLNEKLEAATEATSELIRSEIVPRIQKVLDAFDEAWREAAAKLKANGQGIDELDLDKLYPDVWPALDDLKAKTKTAKDARGLEIIAALTEFQHSGRRLVTVVQRIAEDPVAPLKEKARAIFQQFRIKVEKYRKGVGGIDVLLAERKNAVLADLKKYIDDLPNTDGFKAIAPMMVDFPFPERVDASPELEARLAEASRKAAIAYLQSELLTAQTPSANALKAAAIGALENLSNLNKVEKEKIDAIRKRIDALESGAEEVLGGPVLRRYFGHDGELEKVRRILAQTSPHLDALRRHLADELQNAARSLIESKLDAWRKAACSDVVVPLSNCVIASLSGWEVPIGSGKSPKQLLVKLADAIDPVDNAKGDADKGGKSGGAVATPSQMATLGGRLRGAIGAITKAIDVIKAFDAKAKACKAAAKPELDVADLQRALAAMQVLSSACFDVLKAMAFALNKTGDARIFSQFVVEAAGPDLKPTIPFDDILQCVRQFYPLAPAFAEIEKMLEQAAKQLAASADVAAARLARDYVDRIKKRLGETKDKYAAFVERINGVANATDLPSDPHKRMEEQLDRLAKILDANGVFAEGKRNLDETILSIAGEIASAREGLSQAIASQIANVLTPLGGALNEAVYKPLIAIRDDVVKSMGGKGDDRGILAFFKSLLSKAGGSKFDDIFYVGARDEKTGDDLNRDSALLASWGSVKDTDAFLATLQTFAAAWSNGDASPLRLIKSIERLLTAVLRGDISQFIDMQALKREVDAEIRKMVPAKVSQSYDLKLRLENVGSLIAFDKPQPPLPMHDPAAAAKMLVLRMRGEIDLFDPTKTSLEATGYLPGFALNLLPGFDVAKIIFPPSTFVGGQGKTTSFTLKIGSVILGEKVSFLKDLQSIMGGSPDGTGFYMRPLSRPGSVGIVAGYGFGLPAITLGNMYIDNLSLQVAAELCFDNNDARFIIGISRADAPFMISVAPYAGAGHLALYANAHGFIGFEASFQFGGGGGFSFGPLTGKGRISVGIFVRKIEGFTELYGLFYAGGSARIACFSCSAELNVRMAQNGGGDLEGEAVFTYSFSIGIKDIHFSINVFKKEPRKAQSQNGGQQHGALHPTRFALDLDPTEYRAIDEAAVRTAESHARIATDPQQKLFVALGTPKIVNATVCKANDFTQHAAYTAATQKAWMFP